MKFRYPLIILILLSCIGYNNVYSQFNVVHDIPWKSDTVGMWGPSSYVWSFSHIDTLMDIEVGPYSNTYSVVQNFGLFDSVGIIFDYGTYMGMEMVFEMSGFSGGEVYVNYPTKIDMGFPNNLSFNNGDWVTITSDYREFDSTIYTENDKWRLYSEWPNPGKIRLYLNFDLQANIDVIYSDFQDPFNITWDTINVIPPINIDLDTFDIFLIDLENGEYKIPWVDYHYDMFGNPVIDSVYFLEDSLYPVVFPPIFYDLIGITGDIQMPDIQTADWIENEQRLYAGGSSEYLHIQLDIIKFIQVMCKYAGYEPVSQALEYEEGDTSIFIMTDPISGEDFTLNAEWDLIDAELLMTSTMNQKLSFCDNKEYYDIFGTPIPPDHYPNVWNVFEFPTPVDYRIYDLTSTIIEQGTSDSIKYGADYDIEIKQPCFDYDTLDITTSHTIDPWLTNLIQDSISFDFHLKIMEMDFSIGTTSDTLIQANYPPLLDTIYPLGTVAGLPVFGPILQMPWEIDGFFPDTTFIPDVPIVGNLDELTIDTISLQDTMCFYSNYAEAVAVGGAPPYEYIWTDGTDTLSVDSGISNLHAGTWTYYLTVTDALECSKDTNISITVHANPVASAINNGPVCEGEALTLTGVPGGMSSYSWTGPGSFSSLSQNPTVSTSAATAMAGVYTLTLTDTNGCTNDTNTVVTVNINPTANAADNSPVCEGEALTLTGGTGGMSSYSWTGPNSFSSILQSPAVSANATTAMAGVYTLTISDSNACSDITNTTVTVNANPVASAISNGPVCEGAILALTGGPVGMSSYSWTGANSFSSSFQSPTVSTNATTAMAGVYVLTVVDTNGCTDDTNTTVTVNTIPTASASNNGPVCEGTILTLTGGTNGMSSYSWTGPASFNSLSQNPTVLTSATTAMAGVYTLTVTDSNGCIHDTNTTVTVNANPVASAVNNGPVCEGAMLTLIGGPSGMWSYSWTGPDGFSSFLQSTPVSTNVTTAMAGVYTLIISDSNGCIDDTTTTVTVNTNPVAVAANNGPVCEGEALTLTGVPGGMSSYSWTGPGSYNSITQSPTVSTNATTAMTGAYTLTLTDNNGCTDDTNTVITVNINPTSSAASNSPICEGEALTLTGGTSGMSSYSWTGPNSFSSIVQSPAVSANATTAMAGVYTLTISDSNACSDITNATVTVNSNPVASAISNGPVCEEEILALTGGPGGMSSYTWSGPIGFNSILQSPSISTNANVTMAGLYTLTVATVDGCIDDTTLVVEVNSLPQPGLSADTTQFCSPWCVEFTDTSSITVGSLTGWAWDVDNDGNIDYTTPNATHCYSNEGQLPITYDISLVATSFEGCSDTLTINDMIAVFPNPIAGFTAEPNPASILYPHVTFTNTSSGTLSDPVIYWWNFGDLTSWVGFDATHAYSNVDTGTYAVELSVQNSYGCSDTIIHSVVIEGDYTLFVPSGFSPNDDGLNDSFSPKYTGIDQREFEMYIFNRWGDMIYHTNDIDKPWDGSVNEGGEIAQQDVYVWVIKTLDISGQKHEYVGHVALIR